MENENKELNEGIGVEAASTGTDSQSTAADVHMENETEILSLADQKKAINLQDLIYVKLYIKQRETAIRNELANQLTSAINSKVSDAISDLLNDITNGDLVAKNAINAENATNATNDGDGNKISETYCKKTDTVRYAKSLATYLIGTISNPITITDGQTLSIPVGDTLMNAMKSLSDFPIIYLVVKTSNVSDASYIPLIRTGFELKQVTGSDAYECIQTVFEASSISKLTDTYSYCQKYLLTWNKGNSNVQLSYETISLKNN